MRMLCVTARLFCRQRTHDHALCRVLLMPRFASHVRLPAAPRAAPPSFRCSWPRWCSWPSLIVTYVVAETRGAPPATDLEDRFQLPRARPVGRHRAPHGGVRGSAAGHARLPARLGRRRASADFADYFAHAAPERALSRHRGARHRRHRPAGAARRPRRRDARRRLSRLRRQAARAARRSTPRSPTSSR